jgi:hypothetical protein
MGGKYTGQHQDAHSALAAVRGHVLADDYAHMKWILLDGCPAQLDFEEPLSNKIKMIKCGNSKSFNNLSRPNIITGKINYFYRYIILYQINILLVQYGKCLFT